jgi:hypothetical protein
LIVAETPAREFGKRRPAPLEPVPAVKRSRHVALLLMGTFAIGGGAYALMPAENCEPKAPGMEAPSLPQSGAGCGRGSTTSSTHGGSGGWWTRRGFFSADSTSDASNPSAASEPGGVTRGGFGGFARAFAAHFSGGG